MLRYKHLPPAQEAPPEYDLKSLSAPVMTGWALRAFSTVLETSGGSSLISPIIMWQSGITQVLHGIVVPEHPAFLPELSVAGAADEPETEPFPQHRNAEESLSSVLEGGYLQSFDIPDRQLPWRASIRDYLHAYKSGTVTPAQAMKRLVAFIKASEARQPRPCAWLVAWSEQDILRQAQDSTQRYCEGRPRLLEGVPFVVKDVADALPYPTTAGTSFLSARRPVKASAPFVLALQRMGAVLLGKSNMHEIGLGVTGLNLRTGTPLNPWGCDHFTGGSSSGSAALLAAGICPIAIGTDGGGSIRIPASFCGCVGLKPTMGRVTSRGGVEIDCTVATYGPMGGSVEDCALLYAAIANQDQWSTLHNDPLPAPRLPRPLPVAMLPTEGDASAENTARGSTKMDTAAAAAAVGHVKNEAAAASGPGLPLAGVKIGVFWQWFNDSDPEVQAACQAAVADAVAQGAQLLEVAVPELELMRVAHTVTIVSEMHHCMQPYWDDPATRAAFNADVRLNLSTVRNWTSADYLTAQRIRARGVIHFKRLLSTVDVLVTPSTPCTAPAISPAAYAGGCSDLGQVSKIMRFAPQANLLGLPGISVPVGLDSKGLPIGLQFIGKPWAEGTLLRLASVVESVVRPKMRKQAPAVWINPLTGECAGL